MFKFDGQASVKHEKEILKRIGSYSYEKFKEMDRTKLNKEKQEMEESKIIYDESNKSLKQAYDERRRLENQYLMALESEKRAKLLSQNLKNRLLNLDAKILEMEEEESKALTNFLKEEKEFKAEQKRIREEFLKSIEKDLEKGESEIKIVKKVEKAKN